ncbi:amidohydrolase [Homoserinibacter sp. YIM 151385]|uniref:amidohydrolase n=1 Tax=Homoserinibacter sp. YIM 151385 TaxID=2985506 RepID=UPI0022F09DE5|nr:amidohydrolase [Homoserinibacter sp. YIM 151385]WBU36721.1 amidohydrolase [Homoserinibacter sp. YIM 151385]
MTQHSGAPATTPPITIYPAAKVVTLDHARPVAEAVAVRGDRILAAGSMQELSLFEGATVDDRYADRVIFPGFVEAHAHPMTGGLWRSTYLGYFERTDPWGRAWPGCTTLDEVIERLQEADAAMEDPDALLFAWGLDPLYFRSERLLAKHLDRVSTTRPIFVLHAGAHFASVNSALMRGAGITRDLNVEGLARDEHGEPNGELQEFAAMSLAKEGWAQALDALDEEAVVNFGLECRNVGITTVVDLASTTLFTGGLDVYRAAAESDAFPARLVPFHWGMAPTPGMTLDEVAAALQVLAADSTAKLKFGYVKLLLDGAIQGHTARLLEPGYLNTDVNGIWNVSPEQFEDAFTVFHNAGMVVHVHCNGDEATELMLDTVERILTRHPRPDHRHTVTHSQLSTAAQYRRMKALGLCANIFANHIWYLGDLHYDLTLGPDRAARMDAAATAIREGVPISLHCDAPVTPLGPLSTASYAVERRTAGGRLLGPGEAITLDQALRAVTLGSAYMLKLDHEVGSIEGGKRADFAILDRDPYEVADPAELRAITVLGTVLGGEHHTAAAKRLPEPAQT